MDPSKEELAHHFETAIDAARHHLIGESMARSQTNSFPSSSKSFDNSSQGRSAQDVLNLIDTLSREARKDREEKQKARKEALSQSRWFSVRKEASPESSTTTSVPPNMSSSTKTPEEAAEEARKKLLDRLKAENPIGSLSSPLSRYMAGWESGKTGETFDKFFNSIKDGRWKEYAGTLPLSASTTAERIVDKVKDWISSFK